MFFSITGAGNPGAPGSIHLQCFTLIFTAVVSHLILQRRDAGEAFPDGKEVVFNEQRKLPTIHSRLRLPGKV